MPRCKSMPRRKALSLFLTITVDLRNASSRHSSKVSHIRETLPTPLNRHSVDNTKVTDHHAIIPTGEAPLGLSTDETNIYQMVVNRFIEAFSPDSEEERMQVRFTDGTNTFTWKACRQISLGWKAVQKSCPVYRCPNADSRVSASMPRSYKQDIK